ncbi:hypothetical protein ACE01N_19540 [Saccharicrinis sp. FJH2]|uniref:hypothetical protein n=1 Tax=Saccharicrinis sp. FJH65 TaxID=3344659 RepID=UPI0035F3F003
MRPLLIIQVILFVSSISSKAQLKDSNSIRTIPIQFGIYNHDSLFQYGLNDTLEIKVTDSEQAYFYKKIFKNILIRITEDGSIKIFENDDVFLITDTAYLNVFEDRIKVFKFEYENPAVDGEVCILANSKYGLIGYRSFTWGQNAIILNWNEMKADSNFAKTIISDSLLIPKKIALSKKEKKFLDSLNIVKENDNSLIE